MKKSNNNIQLEWSSLDWHHIQKRVRKLQYKIFNYSRQNDVTRLHLLQQTLVSCLQAKILAVRQITQDNQGKKTPGIDGKSSLTPKARIELVKELKIDGKTSEIKRVFIPKGKHEFRPLGIPTIKDRAKQALAKLALEPQWEAKFEINSYGFRPGRRCQDAIEAIHLGINKKAKYVLDADITKCFDEINHEALISKLETFPQMKRQITAWLKAGILNQNEWIFPEKGTPQGGVLSPLLANIALHGLENHLKEKMEDIPLRSPQGDKTLPKRDRRNSLQVIRYADDFVLMHEELYVVEAMKLHTIEWLAKIGLELNPKKTKIRHTLKKSLTATIEKPGFKFLGFHIRNYEVGKHREKAKKQGFRTMIKPGKEEIKTHYRKIKHVLKELNTIEGLIMKLNPIIRGWTNYYSHVASKKVFAKLDSLMLISLMKWAKRKHTTRSKKWLTNKYLKKIKNRLRFGYDFKGKWSWVITHAETPVKRYTKIKGEASPYDQDWVYWKLNGRNIQREDSKTVTLVKKQKGMCNWCKSIFTPMDRVEVDHIKPRKLGGSSKMWNLQALHRHCHEAKTKKE